MVNSGNDKSSTLVAETNDNRARRMTDSLKARIYI